MNRSHQSGIAHLVLVIIVLVGLVITAVGYRVLRQNPSKETADQGSNTSTDEAAPQLFNFGLQSVNPETGDVLISADALREYDNRGLKGFYVFGEQLEGGRRNPNFEFSSIKPGTKIIAASDGKVVDVRQQPESDDYEVIIVAGNNSIWSIGYDHLINVSVKRDDTVKAGDVLGEPAPQNNGLLRFEIQVNKDADGQTTHVCPSTLLAEQVKDVQLNDLAAMQQAWNTLSGKNLYTLSAQNPVGCLMTTLTPQQAEGQ